MEEDSWAGEAGLGPRPGSQETVGAGPVPRTHRSGRAPDPCLATGLPETRVSLGIRRRAGLQGQRSG